MMASKFIELIGNFSLRTKVIVLTAPLLLGIISLSFVSIFSGIALTKRIDATNAGITTLSSVNESSKAIAAFLESPSTENNQLLTDVMNRQLETVQQNRVHASNEEQLSNIGRTSQLIKSMIEGKDALWAIEAERRDTNTAFDDILENLDTTRLDLSQNLQLFSAKVYGLNSEANQLVRDTNLFRTSAETLQTMTFDYKVMTEPDELVEKIKTETPQISAMVDELSSRLEVHDKLLGKGISATFPEFLAIGQATEPTKEEVVQAQKLIGKMGLLSKRLERRADQTSRAAIDAFTQADEGVQNSRALIKSSEDAIEQLVKTQLAAIAVRNSTNNETQNQLSSQLSAQDAAIANLASLDTQQSNFLPILERLQSQLESLGEVSSKLVATAEMQKTVLQQMRSSNSEAQENIIAFSNKQRTAAADVADSTIQLSALAAAIFTVFGAAACFVMTWLIRGPIVKLTNNMSEVAGGNLEVNILGLNRKDEIGEMARALDVFKQNAKEKIETQAQTERVQKQAEQVRSKSEAERQATLANQEAAISELGHGLDLLANGDLSHQINTRFDGALDQLREDYNKTVARMRDTLLHIRRNAEAADSTSSQLSNAATDLSKRTENQALDLQETAVALEEISTTVASASERAKTTNELATETRTKTAKSADVVSDAVKAMESIKEASHQINSIISVIDEIAFQTNLLALNAGVEAARAGEAGAGFAVVAQEVRELAGRSARAAKEIKTLINQSAVEVANGVELVDHTGTVISEVMVAIDEISEHIRSIAQSSEEQALGLKSINESVSSIDGSTQQNASVAVETSTSTQTLTKDIFELNRLIASFRLEEEVSREEEMAVA